MTNFDKINDAINSLSANDRNRLSEIIISYGDEFAKNPIKVFLDSISQISTEFTDERKNEFMSNLKDVDANNQEVLVKGICGFFSNIDYIDWLTNFTLKNDYVDTRNTVYKIYEESETDKENLENLKYFFKGIDIYANDKQIKSFTMPDNSCWYYVKYNETILKITSCNVGKSYSCTVSDIDSRVYIEFNELMKYYLFIKNNDGVQRKRVDD